MIKTTYLKIMPIVTFILLSSCSTSFTGAKTYRTVLQEDYYKIHKVDCDYYGLKPSKIEISRAYAYNENIIIFNVPLKQTFGSFTGASHNVRYGEMEIYFSSETLVPLVWRNHKLSRLHIFINNPGKEYLDEEMFAKVKRLYENDQNDFSFLFLPYNGD